jgi:hypothetical protein
VSIASCRSSSLSLLLVLLAASAAQAQQPDGESAEARALREAAEAEAAGEGVAPSSPEEALRRSAEVEAAEGQSILYRQLVDNFQAIANRANSFNPRLTVIGDVLGRWSVGSHERVEDGIDLDDRISLREMELDLRADIDPYAKGVAILAFEEESPGEYAATLEEGYLTLEALPAGFRAQIGRFRVPFGRINTLHIHDLPQPEYPLALQDIFGEEGFAENGVLVSWLAPKFPLELTVALLNGENDVAFAGTNSDDPVWLGRAEYFIQITDDIFTSVGTSFLFGYNDAPDPLTDLPSEAQQETQVWGADVLFKWRWNELRSVAVQGEVYNLKKELTGARDHAFGAYGYLQVQPLDRWYLGLKYDWSDYDEQVEDADQWAVSAFVSYYTTEFLRFRVGYEHRERSTTNGGQPDLDTILFQITFVFGSHPAEPFWVNR